MGLYEYESLNGGYELNDGSDDWLLMSARFLSIMVISAKKDERMLEEGF